MEKGKFNGAIAIVLEFLVVEIEFAVLACYCIDDDIDVIDLSNERNFKLKKSPTLSTFEMDTRTHGRTDARKKKKNSKCAIFYLSIQH